MKKNSPFIWLTLILVVGTTIPFSTSASPDLLNLKSHDQSPQPTPMDHNDGLNIYSKRPHPEVAGLQDIRLGKSKLNIPDDITTHRMPGAGYYRPDESANPVEINSSQPLAISPNAGTGIYGRVTQNGSSASGVSLDLRFYNGSSWSTQATTSTDSGGNFQFTGAPSLTAGQIYYVQYYNPNNASRLWWWNTRDLYEYTAGSNVLIGNFDIAGISLISPPNSNPPYFNEIISFPYTFQWTKRTASPTDVYELDLFRAQLYTYDPWWWMVVGNAGSHRLYCLPPDFDPGSAYIWNWDVWVYSPDGGYGESYDWRLVRFDNFPTCNGIRGQVTQNGTPVSDTVNLVLYNGTSIFNASQMDTEADGTFKFGNVPNPGSGSRYWVEYINSENTSGRLSFWSTRSLTSYTPNSDVQIGDFDIADIPLVSPTDGVTETIPMTFTWTVRTSTPTDSYSVAIGQEEILLFGGGGYTSTYTLKCMFPVLEAGNSYKWDLWAFSPDGGFGESLNYRSISFSGGPDCLKTFLPVVLR